jgi:hypothetical protein
VYKYLWSNAAYICCFHINFLISTEKFMVYCTSLDGWTPSASLLQMPVTCTFLPLENTALHSGVDSISVFCSVFQSFL